MRFEPLVGERDGKYFLVILDSPHENEKWVLYTERKGFFIPEFQCAKVNSMTRYINDMARELAAAEPQPIPQKSANKSPKKKEVER